MITDIMYREVVTIKEKLSTYTDGKPEFALPVEFYAIELPVTSDLRDSFGNVDVYTVIQVKTDKQIPVNSKIEHQGKEYDVKGCIVLKNTSTLDIIGCKLAL